MQLYDDLHVEAKSVGFHIIINLYCWHKDTSSNLRGKVSIEVVNICKQPNQNWISKVQNPCYFICILYFLQLMLNNKKCIRYLCSNCINQHFSQHCVRKRNRFRKENRKICRNDGILAYFWKMEYGRLQKCSRNVHRFKKFSPSFYAYTYVQKYAIMSDETCDSTFI